MITDNTGTSGTGKAQIEISNGLGFRNEHRCFEKTTEINPVLTFGLLKNIDLVLAYPFMFSSVYEDTSINKVAGFSDFSLEIKYCFLKKEILSVAIKPGISFPTGNFSQELGSGKISVSAFIISSFNLAPIVFNGNMGYLRNANKCGDALNIWHFSADADYAISNELHAVLNGGIEKNPDPSSKTLPVFGLFGMYFCINNSSEISLGYKNGLTKPETDHMFIYGFTKRF